MRKTKALRWLLSNWMLTPPRTRGIRLGYLPQIRDIEDGIMEQIFAGKVSPAEGLKAMTTRGNELLERFEKSVN